MFEWLANHHEWVLILALLWVVFVLFQPVKSKYNKRTNKKKEKSSHDGASLGDLISTSTGHGKPAGYSGGSGGGAGSARSFVPADSANSTAGSIDTIRGMAIVSDIAATDPASIEGVSDIILPTPLPTDVNVPAISAERIDLEAAVETIVETAVETAGDIIAGILKD